MVVFPFLMVLSISLRPGNFATGSVIPETISSSTGASRSACPTPDAQGRLAGPTFPVLRWLWNSVKIATLSALIGLLLSTTAAYAFAA
jgi:maltose/maltodextrin transport system permease protein